MDLAFGEPCPGSASVCVHDTADDLAIPKDYRSARFAGTRMDVEVDVNEEEVEEVGRTGR